MRAIPSGHTQNAAVLWSYLAGYYKKTSLIAAAVVMVPLVGLGRIYRGAHWPIDVLGGMAIGVALVWLALTIYRLWDRGGISLPLWGQLALGLAVPLALFAVYPKTSMQTGAALGDGVRQGGEGLAFRPVGFGQELNTSKLRCDSIPFDLVCCRRGSTSRHCGDCSVPRARMPSESEPARLHGNCIQRTVSADTS